MSTLKKSPQMIMLSPTTPGLSSLTQQIRMRTLEPDWIPVLSLTPISCVTLHMLLYLSVLQFPHL